MKSLLLGVFFFLLSFKILAQKATDDFSGLWNIPEGKVVEITKKESLLEGKILDLDKLILKDISFKKGKWKGTLIRPKDNEKLNCELTLQGTELKIKVVKGLLSKTMVWTRKE